MIDVAMIETIQTIVASPWYAVMAALWGIGWYIKVQMPAIVNNWIPTILSIIGVILGYTIIASDFTGIVAGFLMAIVTVGVHSGTKNTVELFLKKEE